MDEERTPKHIASNGGVGAKNMAGKGVTLYVPTTSMIQSKPC